MYILRTYHQAPRVAAAAIATALLAATVAAAQPDTTRSASDTSAPAKIPAELPMSRSPLVAVLLSGVPGGGQIYTAEYFKAAIFLGVAAGVGWQVYQYNRQFSDYAAQADAVADKSSSEYLQLKRLREYNRDQRDYYAALFIATQIVSMIDAYVGAHLFDFDVGDEDQGASVGFDFRRGLGFQVRW